MKVIVICDSEQEFHEMSNSFEYFRRFYGFDKLIFEKPTYVNTLTLNQNGSIRYGSIHKEMEFGKIIDRLFEVPNPVNEIIN